MTGLDSDKSLISLHILKMEKDQGVIANDHQPQYFVFLFMFLSFIKQQKLMKMCAINAGIDNDFPDVQGRMMNQFQL